MDEIKENQTRPTGRFKFSKGDTEADKRYYGNGGRVKEHEFQEVSVNRSREAARRRRQKERIETKRKAKETGDAQES